MKKIYSNLVTWYFSNCLYAYSFSIALILVSYVFNEEWILGVCFLFTTLLSVNFTFSVFISTLKIFSKNYPIILNNTIDSTHKKIIKEIGEDLSIQLPNTAALLLFLIFITKFDILNIISTEYGFFNLNEREKTHLLLAVINLFLFFTTLSELHKIIEPILKIEESLTPHQSKEEILYEELRTRFAFHNITKDVRNLKSYITILKHEEPQLSSKFNTLDELTDMIEDTLSKFKNSDTIRTKNPFLVHELFDNFLILNKPDLVREGSDLQIEYQKTEYKNIEIHQTFYEVYQVLNNLIDNARKAIANVEQKEIQILTSVSKEGFVDFRVSDTGVGIDAKARNRVFDIGYSTTNGDGLGLLFVQTTLKRFGGKIQLLPTAISGFSTTFEVRIPTQKG